MALTSVKVYAKPRPFVLDFGTPGGQYPLGSEEVQRLLDTYPVIRATRNRVALRGDDGRAVNVYPATIGGGPAFEIVR